MISLAEADALAQADPAVPAVIDGDVTLTRRDFADRVRGLLHYLLDVHDAHEFRRAVFISDNNWHVVVAMSAFTTLGVSFLGLDYSRTIDAQLRPARTVDPDCIFYSAAHAERGSRLAAELAIPALYGDDRQLTDSPNSDPLHAAKVEAASARPFERLMFTSGTTDIPKVIRRTKSFDKRRYAALTKRFDFSGNDRHLITVPFHHYSSVGWGKLFFGLGAPIVLGDPHDSVGLARDLVKRQITTMLIVPPVLEPVGK